MMRSGKAKALRLGCPVWAFKPWVGNFYTSDAKRSDYLAQYSRVFNAVEGNSSFYGLPKKETIVRWCDEVEEGFDFCFKFPRVVSHDLLLRNAEKETLEFIRRIEPLGGRLGSFFLQLPPYFEPRHLSYLIAYVRSLPSEFRYAVDVRNPEFFRGTAAVEIDTALSDLGVDRVIFDTRALFAKKATDEMTTHAQRRKPSLPVAKKVVGSCPFIRFVGHPDENTTHSFLQEWVEPVLRWLDQGLQPYFFTHMPDDLLAPHLSRRFAQMLSSAGLDLEIPKWPAELEPECPVQMDLFE